MGCSGVTDMISAFHSTNNSTNVSLNIMKNATLSLFLLLSAFPSLAALPIVINSGNVATCAPGGLVGNNLSRDITNTVFDTYYTSECYYPAASTQTISDADIIAGQSYTLYLHFAEIYFGAGNPGGGGNGSRIFDLLVNGQMILDNLDIHALSGPSQALVFRYDVTATTSGSLTVGLIPVIQNAQISAIEVRPFGQGSELPPLGSIFDLTTPGFPVEWLDLDVTARGQQALLTWSTAWESNNEGFEVEMGRVGQAFESLGFVAGAGQSTSPLSYQFLTGGLSPGRYLFRLRQRDFDGQMSFSPLLELKVGAGPSLSVMPVSPNPTTGAAMLRMYADMGEEIEWNIWTMDGRQMAAPRRLEATGFEQQLQIDPLPPGLYVLRLWSATTNSSQRLLVLEGK